MSFNPGVSFFVAFHELDPLQQRQCIFYTLKGKRCGWSCLELDNSKARELYDQISRIPSTELPSLELLENYARYNCCGPKPKGARHQNRIEDIELLAPLAERWLEEIKQRRLADRKIVHSVVSTTPVEANTVSTSPISSASTIFSPSTPGRYSEVSATTHSYQISTGIATGFLPSPPPSEQSLGESLKPIEHESQTGGVVPRYDFRRRDATENKESGTTSSNSTPRAPLSAFRPHVEEPEENVLSKLLTPLVKDDFKPGSLYIFNRASSPGYVKIGWTSRTVQGRLDSWAKCGYEPNLVFSVGDVPYAQRAETLTHYQLVAEWRAERSCKGCAKSHREWFEIKQEKAAQVVADWADFMKVARPYDVDGLIKSSWRHTIEEMHKTNAPVTANKLLTYYKVSLLAKNVPVKPVEVDRALKVEAVAGEISSIPGTDQDKFDPPEERKSSVLANTPLNPELNLQPQLGFTFEPQLSKIKWPLSTLPLRMTQTSPTTSFGNKLGPSLLEKDKKETIWKPTAKFQLENKVELSYETPAKQPGFGTDTKFDFSLSGLPAKQLDFGKNTMFGFSHKTPTIEESVVGTDAKDALSTGTPPMKQPVLGMQTGFDFSQKIPPAEQSASATATKFDFTFKTPLTKQSNLGTDKPFDISCKSHPIEQSALGTDTNFDFSFNTPSEKQLASKKDRKFDFSYQTPPVEPTVYRTDRTPDFFSNLAPAAQLMTPPEEKLVLGTGTTFDFSFKTPTAKQLPSGNDAKFDFSFQTPPATQLTLRSRPFPETIPLPPSPPLEHLPLLGKPPRNILDGPH